MRNNNTQPFAGAIVAAVTLFLIGASPALAGDTATTSRVVDVQDLDLGVASSQATLRHRLHVAASRVCRDGDDAAVLNSAAYLDCSRTAFQDAWSRAQVLIASATTRSLLAARAVPASMQPERLADK